MGWNPQLLMLLTDSERKGREVFPTSHTATQSSLPVTILGVWGCHEMEWMARVWPWSVRTSCCVVVSKSFTLLSFPAASNRPWLGWKRAIRETVF